MNFNEVNYCNANIFNLKVAGLLRPMVHMHGDIASSRNKETLEIIANQVNNGHVHLGKSILAEVPSRFHSKFVIS